MADAGSPVMAGRSRSPFRTTSGARRHGRLILTLDLLLVNENLEPVWASRERVATERGSVWVVSRQGLIDMTAWSAASRTWPTSGACAGSTG